MTELLKLQVVYVGRAELCEISSCFSKGIEVKVKVRCHLEGICPPFVGAGLQGCSPTPLEAIHTEPNVAITQCESTLAPKLKPR